MEINLKNLSTEELNDLRKKVLVEVEFRNSFYKSSTHIYERLCNLFCEDLLKTGVGKDAVTKPIVAMERAIYKLCDITLKNYKLNKGGGIGDKGNLVVNGAVVMCDSNLYQNMVDDLFAVVLKHKENLDCINKTKGEKR